MIKFSAFTLAVILSARMLGAPQDRAKANEMSQHVPVRLLPGFQVSLGTGIDTWDGTIWKDGGVKIDVSMGCTLGSEADSIDKKAVLWRAEQIVEGMRTIAVFTSAHDLVVTYPKQCANFRSRIRSQKDLAEVLMTVLTYEPTRGYPLGPRISK